MNANIRLSTTFCCAARFNALLAVAARMFQESYPDSASETVPSTKRVRSNHFKSHIQNATSVRAQQLRLPALKIKVPFAVQDAAAEGHTAQPQQHRRLNNPAHMDSDSSACSATSSELGVRILASRDSNTTPIQRTIVRQQPPIKLYLQTSSGLPRVLTHDQPPYQVSADPCTVHGPLCCHMCQICCLTCQAYVLSAQHYAIQQLA